MKFKHYFTRVTEMFDLNLYQNLSKVSKDKRISSFRLSGKVKVP